MKRKHDDYLPEEEDGEYLVYQAGFFLKSSRCLMYTFNAVFFAFAAFLFALCIWIRFDPLMDKKVREIHFSYYWKGTILLMVGAVLVMVASFVGSCGTRFWNTKLIVTFAILTGVSFVLNMSGAVYMLSIGLERTRAYPFIQRYFRGLIYQYYTNTDARRTVDIIQEYIGCCGAYVTGDWQDLNLPVPNSCRNKVTGNQYGDSCAEVVSWYLQYRTGWVSGIALCICFLQLFTTLFAVCMYRGIRERRVVYQQSSYVQ